MDSGLVPGAGREAESGSGEEGHGGLSVLCTRSCLPPDSPEREGHRTQPLRKWDSTPGLPDSKPWSHGHRAICALPWGPPSLAEFFWLIPNVDITEKPHAAGSVWKVVPGRERVWEGCQVYGILYHPCPHRVTWTSAVSLHGFGTLYLVLFTMPSTVPGPGGCLVVF